MEFKPRLQRLKWHYSDCVIYFLTTCTENRACILANSGIHQGFIRFAEAAASRQVWVGRYTIMPDHIHLFAGFSHASPSISQWIKALKGNLAHELRKTSGERTHWQKTFFDHVIRLRESYRENKWEYVRMNPVRAGLVARPEDWPYQGEIHPL